MKQSRTGSTEVQRTWPRLREAVLDAAAIVLPVSCAGCGVDGRSVCQECRRAILPNPAVHESTAGVPVVSSTQYDGVVRAVIVALKENGRRDAAATVARALEASVRFALAERDGSRAPLGDPPRGIELAVVPSSRAAYRRRGFDPVTLLIARAGLPRPARVLRRTRVVAAQKSLDSSARVRNARGSLAAVARLDGRRFILVDDVVTTGSTVAEAVRAITVAGGDVVAVAVAAATPKRGRNHPAPDDIAALGD